MGTVMSGKAGEARRAYQREYRRENRERISSRQKGLIRPGTKNYRGWSGTINIAYRAADRPCSGQGGGRARQFHHSWTAH